MLKKIIIFTLLFTTTIGCTEQQKTDSQKFKEEFEQYNEEKIELEISEDNIIKYATTNELNELIDKKTGVIFIGNPEENLSRTALNVLLKAAENTDLKTIYYINNYKDIKEVEKIEYVKTPLVLNILEGEILSYHMGTIENKEKLSEDEELTLYNLYSDGIHTVLQDSCSEECKE